MSNEKRNSSRFKVDLPVSFRRLSERTLDARIQNLSAGGAFLLAPDPPKMGELVQVHCGKSIELIGTVVYVVEFQSQLCGFAIRFFQHGGEDVRAGASDGANPTSARRPKGLNVDAFEYYASLNKVRRFVVEHFAEDVSLERVAQIAAQERTYFSRFFHEKVGITYREWLQYIRIQRAIELLKKSDQTVTEAAHAVGFGDLRTFERTFKKWTSMVPRDFKKLVAPGTGPAAAEKPAPNRKPRSGMRNS